MSLNSLSSNSSTRSPGNEIIPATQQGEETEGAQSHHPSTTKKGTAKIAAAKRKRVEKAQKVKKSKERSWIWAHFIKVEHPLMETVDGIEQEIGHATRAQCKYCTTHLACNSTSNGTSSLIKHIEVICKEYPGRKELAASQTQLGADDLDENMVTRHWTQEACIQAATVMIVMDEMPFSSIERPGFKYFCKVAIPKWKIPCRKVIVKIFLKMYQSKKEELRKELSCHCVCLTTDTWTSLQNINYMVLTAHFIDNGWKLHKRVLNFCVISNHQGVTIGRILESCLRAWSIDRVLTISVDNASANKHAIDYIRDKMNDWEKSAIFGGKYLHVRCLAHIVNLIVRSALHLLDKSVSSIRNAVRYVRSSSSRLDAFRSCIEKEVGDCKRICVLDVPTRWNSTYIMLETVLELRKAFDRLKHDEDSKYTSYFDEDEEAVEEDGEEPGDFSVDLSAIRSSRASRKRVRPPNAADWEKAVVFVKFLKVFYNVTLSVSAINHPTSPKAFHDIVSIHVEIEDLFCQPVDNHDVTQKILFQMAQKMRVKYQKYFGKLGDINQLLLVALVLDPRYKILFFENVCKKMLNMEDLVIKKKSVELKELVVSLTDLYAAALPSQSSQRTRSSEVTQTAGSSRYTSTRVTGKMADMLEEWDRELEDGDAVVVNNEVDRYLLDPIEKPPKGIEFNILTWWKLNGPKYPNLQTVAKDVLAIQVSTVLKSDSIIGLAYVPTPEEMEWFEEVEKEQDKEERERKEKEATTSSIPSKGSKGSEEDVGMSPSKDNALAAKNPAIF
ncbi:zinc finger BED domain-containing protein RICESLEEPER 2-like [Rosa chinensis]|uniref:zinc finger BED domain-containing protein RICESLEEPER 2-like n=1 Tax=Rosa chinensis TaxID=74649 RepID=UPI001AD8E6B0|nr:zinc finger BED domain-containing protein RICESLEEPER 2-like [Rosa chinensis]